MKNDDDSNADGLLLISIVLSVVGGSGFAAWQSSFGAGLWMTVCLLIAIITSMSLEQRT